MDRAPVKSLPPLSRLRELFKYDPESGLVTRRISVSSSARCGDLVGTPTSSGYLRCQVDGRSYYLHRIIWKILHGEDPPEVVDHRNGTKTDNRDENLRSASHAQNMWAKKRSSSNRSGVKGVCYHRRDRKWQAAITVAGKQIYLGSFERIDDAAFAYASTSKRFFGSFSSAGL